MSRPFLHQKALKQSIWSIWLFVATMLWLQKANSQKHSFWVVSSAKMVLTHSKQSDFYKKCFYWIFFSDPKSAVLKLSKYKSGVFSKGHVGFWIVPTFFNLTNHMWALMWISALANDLAIHHPYLPDVNLFILPDITPINFLS